ncbi:MAG: glycine zipper 2TM domain-containing protein [Pseudomonadota bacterium]|nr:glycine zipper 2TM domain-containing protein [Pseudomonadota bacterium]
MKSHSLLSLLSAAALAMSLSACSPQAPTDENATPSAEPTATPEPTPTPVSAAELERQREAREERARERAERERAEAAARVCQECGTISAITPIKQKGQGSGAGAVAGAVAGGVAGHQVGGGRGKDVATVAGAVLGALAGNEVEKRVRSTETYDVLISMDNGSQRQINVPSLGGLSVGTPVRVQGDTISMR